MTMRRHVALTLVELLCDVDKRNEVEAALQRP